jgi:hypothetical protein
MLLKICARRSQEMLNTLNNLQIQSNMLNPLCTILPLDSRQHTHRAKPQKQRDLSHAERKTRQPAGVGKLKKAPGDNARRFT